MSSGIRGHGFWQRTLARLSNKRIYQFRAAAALFGCKRLVLRALSEARGESSVCPEAVELTQPSASQTEQTPRTSKEHQVYFLLLHGGNRDSTVPLANREVDKIHFPPVSSSLRVYHAARAFASSLLPFDAITHLGYAQATLSLARATRSRYCKLSTSMLYSAAQ